jgi:hypothetical protein
LIGVSLACNTESDKSIVDDLIDEGEGFTREEEFEFFENYDPDRIYTVTENNIEDPCDRGYASGEAVPVRIVHQVDNTGKQTVRLEYPWRPLFEPRVFHRVAPLLYCAFTYDDTQVDWLGRSLRYWECLSFSSTGYRHTINGPDDRDCYSAFSVFNPSAEAVESDYTAEEAEATMAAAAEATLAAEATQEAAAEEETEPEDQAQGQVPTFTVDDCDCSGVDLPLESSRASPPGTLESSAGTDFENVESLHCEWADEYRYRLEGDDEDRTKVIWLDLDIYRLNSAEDAQTLFAEFRAEHVERQPDCEEQDDCTVAIADFAPERAFYVEHHIFIRGDGVQFPSLHEAYLMRIITTAGGDSFVLYIWVKHPR